MNKWISVKDRLPEMKEKKVAFSSEYVLAYDGVYSFVARRWKFKPSVDDPDPEISFKEVGCNCTNTLVLPITHWMPLPKPPKE